MNIRRGFFRVWFVLSVLWIVGVIYTGYENTKYVNPDYEDIRKAAYSAMSDKGLMAEAKKQNIPIDGVTGTVRKGWESDFVPDGTLGTVEMPDGTVVRNVPVDVDKEKFKLGGDYEIWKRQHLRNVASETTIEAITFPAIAFSVWFIGCWIGAGFRSKKPT